MTMKPSSTPIHPQHCAFGRTGNGLDLGAKGLTKFEYLVAHAPAMPDGWVIYPKPRDNAARYLGEHIRNQNLSSDVERRMMDLCEFLDEGTEKEALAAGFTPEELASYENLQAEHEALQLADNEAQMKWRVDHTPVKKAAAWAITWAQTVIELSQQEAK